MGGRWRWSVSRREAKVSQNLPVWVTRYALTRGIMKHTDGLLTAGAYRWFIPPKPKGARFLIGHDAFLTRRDAGARVVEMAQQALGPAIAKVDRLEEIIADGGCDVVEVGNA